MDLWHAAVLALVQGITEFLPISSSAHLILIPKLTGWTDQGLMIDVAVHAGTLAAVVLYFHRETLGMVRGGLRLCTGDVRGAEPRLALQIILATLPVVVAGYLLKDQIASDWRSATLIASTTVAFGLLLWFADRGGAGEHRKPFDGMTLRLALLIGLAQVLALVPGVSRSGITMTAALLLGFRREAAARFSLLLSIPTTAAACVLIGYDLWRSGDVALQGEALLAAALSFVAGFLTIAGLMAWLRSATFTPFVAYRLLLGAVLFIWFV